MHRLRSNTPNIFGDQGIGKLRVNKVWNTQCYERVGSSTCTLNYGQIHLDNDRRKVDNAFGQRFFFQNVEHILAYYIQILAFFEFNDEYNYGERR